MNWCLHSILVCSDRVHWPGKMILPIGFVFYFGYFNYQLVGIPFFGLLGVPFLFNFFLVFVQFCMYSRSIFSLQLRQNFSRAAHLLLGFRFGASQNLKPRTFGLLLVLVPFFPVNVS